tara:strand:+ start:479 stop:1282 length:804 start_codon:yes stop_codon:yes gene_type:complete
MGGALVAMLESSALEDAHFKLLIQQDPACTESKSFVCHVLTIFGLLDGKGGGGWGNQSPEQQNGARPFTLIPYAKDDGKLHCFRDLIAPKVGLGRVKGSKVDQPTLAKFVAKLREVLNAESSSQKPSPNLIVSGSKLKKKKKKVWVVYGRADAGRRRWTDSETVVAQLRAAFGANANAVQMSSVVYVRAPIYYFRFVCHHIMSFVLYCIFTINCCSSLSLYYRYRRWVACRTRSRCTSSLTHMCCLPRTVRIWETLSSFNPVQSSAR